MADGSKGLTLSGIVGGYVIARVVGQKVPELLNQSAVTDNKAGANGNIGALQVARVAPGGYIFLMAT